MRFTEESLRRSEPDDFLDVRPVSGWKPASKKETLAATILLAIFLLVLFFAV